MKRGNKERNVHWKYQPGHVNDLCRYLATLVKNGADNPDYVDCNRLQHVKVSSADQLQHIREPSDIRVAELGHVLWIMFVMST